VCVGTLLDQLEGLLAADNVPEAVASHNHVRVLRTQLVGRTAALDIRRLGETETEAAEKGVKGREEERRRGPDARNA
jgi:hypothetical protein